MKKLILILLILFGCSSHHEPVKLNPVCRHKAIFAAITWTNETGERTMIASGPSLMVKGKWHAQAVVMDGMHIKHYLSFDGINVVTDSQDQFKLWTVRSTEEYFSGLMKGEYGGHLTFD